MQPDLTQDFQQFNCLNVLDRMLALAMQTAEAASAEKDHRLVLQAVREVTRLVTLINKISCSPNQKPEAPGKPAVGSTPDPEIETQPGKWEKSGKAKGKKGLLERFFKENKPINHHGKNMATSGLTNPGVNAFQPPNQSPGAIRWQDEPVILRAEEAEAA